MSLALFLDENVDVELAGLLTQAGYDVLTAREAGRANRGLSDQGQLEFATSGAGAIFSHDVKDFDALARSWATQQKHHAGIIVNAVWPVGELYVGLRQLFEWYPDGIANYT